MTNIAARSGSRFVVRFLGAAALAVGGHAPAYAQSYPNKPIRIVAPYAPGVPGDVLARGLIEPLHRALGQPVVVENRVGADGIIGAEICAKAAPDGYTLCAGASGWVIFNPVLRANLPYEPLRDFSGIAMAGYLDSGLVAFPSLPANSVQELIELAKAKPDSVAWGHFGVGSTGYMYMEWLRRSRNAPFYDVPFKTQQQALMAVMAGEAQVSINSTATIAQLVRSGKLKLLAVSGARRAEFAPQVPTFEEVGIKLPLRSWLGYHAPAATPRDIVRRLNAEINKIQSDPAYKANVLARQSIDPVIFTAEEFDSFIARNLKDVADLVAFLGVKPK